jgi:uncharacterized membrane protein YqjE
MSRLAPLGAGERPVPTVTDSLDRVVDAAQSLVEDRVELLKVEATSMVTSALLSGALGLAGAALVGLGWLIVLMAAFQVLVPPIGTLGALAALAAVNLLPGIVLLVLARRGFAEGRHG